MAKPFDATLNVLLDDRAADWVAFLARRTQVPFGPFESLDTDLSRTVQADKVFHIQGPQPAMIHVELESSSHLGIPRDLLRYNVMLFHQYEIPVHSILILLRPKAVASDQTGVLHVPRVDGSVYLEFRYTVLRVWEESPETYLQAGPGLAPLAMLTNGAAADLPGTFEQLVRALQQADLGAKVVGDILGSTYTLCGLRYPEAQLLELYRNISMTLEDSTTYQGILRKGISQGITQGISQGITQGITQGLTQGETRGRLEEARKMVVRLGTKRLGSPDAKTLQVLAQIQDLAQLEQTIDRVFDATSWVDLLGIGPT